MAIPNVPTPSANLSAVAAFARAASEQDSLLQMSDLGDPPPPSSLQPRLPSSRRTLTRALELAREAVQLDAANDNPEAAVKAYGLSVALLSEVMERVRRGEESTDNRRRGGKRRSSTAQEEEVRRLQSIVSISREGSFLEILSFQARHLCGSHEYPQHNLQHSSCSIQFPVLASRPCRQH